MYNYMYEGFYVLLGNVSSFILLCQIFTAIDVEEDDAIEEAIRCSLLEESVQSSQVNFIITKAISRCFHIE